VAEDPPPLAPAVPPPPKPKRRTALWVGVGVAALVLILVAGILGAPPSADSGPGATHPSPSTVHISAVDWAFSGPAGCWKSLASNGTHVTGGRTFTVSIALNYTAPSGGPSNCTVQSESVGTKGFTFVSADTPLLVASGTTRNLTVKLLAPNSNETTGLALQGQVTNSTTAQGPIVNVTAVNWKFSGASNCWTSMTTGGTRVAGGQTFAATVTLNYTAGAGDPSSCTVQSESVGTSGFSYVSADTPLEVPSSGSQTLTVTVQAPDMNLTSVLVLDGNVTSPNDTHTVDVSAVNWDFSGPSNCWSSMSGPGVEVVGGDQFTVSITLNYTAGLLDPSTCTVQSESVGTSGFTYLSANTPLVVSSGGSQVLSVTVQAPDTNETVVLTLDGTVTSP
jgi:hypothetical protein